MKRFLVFLMAVIFFIVGFISFNNFEIKKIKTSGAMAALQFWNTQRAYPNDDIPSRGLYEAFQNKLNKSQNLIESSVAPWKTLGPKNIGGRTNAIVFNPQNPNTIYAGSASGGLWRSYSAGLGASAWSRISIGFPAQAIGAIAIPNNDSSTIYIGTGEVYAYQSSFGGITIRTTRGSYGIGILKSTDAGLTWRKSLDWTLEQQRGIQAIKINPLNSNSIWAGTSEGVFRSVDAGATWQQMNSILMVTDIVINSADTNKILIACGNVGSAGKGIYRSVDNGINWIKSNNIYANNELGKIVFGEYISDPNIIYASVGRGYSSGSGTNLLNTTNFGETWLLVSTYDYSTYQGWFSHFVAVNPSSTNDIICAGVDVFKSTNGGASFTQKAYWYKWYLGVTQPGAPEGPTDYSHADHHAVAFHPENPNILYFGNDGGVFRTTDWGETFEGCNGGYQSTQFYPGFSSASLDSNLAMGGMQDNATAIYQGTVAWNRVIGGDGSWTAIDANNNNILFGSSQNLNVLRSTNRGASFASISIPSSGTTGFIAPFASSASNPSVMYAGRSIIYKSTNGGSNWSATNSGSALDGNPALTISISRFNENIVYASTAPVSSRSGVFITTNGGTLWKNITGTLPNRYPMDIGIDPTDPMTAYVVLSGFGTSHLYKTTNGGNSWIDAGVGLPDIPTSSVVVDIFNPNHIYLGNDLGVYLSTDAGTTWQIFSDGLPEVITAIDLTISPMNKKLRVTTHGNGVYERPLYSSVVGVKNEIVNELNFLLEQNYPNPFNPETKIKFNIPFINNYVDKSPNTKLVVYDILGKEVAALVDEFKAPGNYEVKFQKGNLASGVYLYKLSYGTYSAVKKMVITK